MLMIYFCYFVFGFILLQLFVALINLIFSQQFSSKYRITNELVSVLIPARNEEKNIANILNDLLLQNYQNIEVIVFNDQSTDKTESILKEFSLKDNRFKYINSTELPKAWLGKNYACHSLSLAANGKYFLFLDADVRVSGELISKTVNYLAKYKLGLLSIFPKQIMRSFGEKITVPLMNYILLTLLPLILVRKSNFSSLSAANGQFMLFDACIYNKIKPHEIMKNRKVEDIEIARYYKKNKIKVACISGKEEISCRMYNNYNEALEGFSKNTISFFGNSFILALLFWLLTTFGFMAIMFFMPLGFLIIYFSIFILIRIFVSIVSRQNVIENIGFSLIQQLVLGNILLKSFINKKNKTFVWKERNIS